MAGAELLHYMKLFESVPGSSFFFGSIKMMKEVGSTSARDCTMNQLSYTLQNIFSDKKFKGILNSLMDADATTSSILRFL